MTRGQRAQQIWQVLAGASHNRQVLTYSILAERIGTGAGTLAPLLGAVMHYCANAGLPPLTVIVVNKETGLPGVGLSTVADLGRDRERVFSTSWDTMLPPSATDFETAAKSQIKVASPAGREGDVAAKTLDQAVATGAELNSKWNVNAAHALYHREGCWYHRLTRFPGALFDPKGFVRFESEEDFLHCQYLDIGKHVNVLDQIASMPGYTRVVP
jgi:hypothetical protein